jgi:hypothetical protein
MKDTKTHEELSTTEDTEELGDIHGGDEFAVGVVVGGAVAMIQSPLWAVRRMRGLQMARVQKR